MRRRGLDLRIPRSGPARFSWAAAFAMVAGVLLASTVAIAATALVSAGPVAGTCNPGTSRNPSALDIPVASPSGSASAGATVDSSYAVEVENYTSADAGARISIPTAEAVFPLSPSGSLLLVTPPTTISVTSAGWTTPVVHAKTLGSAISFASTKSAYLTTQKIAIMAPFAYGAMTLEVRWHWTIVPTSGTSTVGAWSTPNATAKSPFLPSIFYPAPYVGLVATSPLPAKAGSNFSVELNGSVANTSFRIVVEYPSNGTEISSVWEATPSGAISWNATASLRYANGNPLAPSTYLLHVHDRCQAIVHSLSLPTKSPKTSYGSAVTGGATPARSSAGAGPAPGAYRSADAPPPGAA